ncbi:hypothetical protein TNCV_3229031 [Trichonephila clavipes]|nr:hypothetical protein TNCV_3229031 [Trichonephila clavipes]
MPIKFDEAQVPHIGVVLKFREWNSGSGAVLVTSQRLKITRTVAIEREGGSFSGDRFVPSKPLSGELGSLGHSANSPL